jgi:hypothetical protein
MNFEIRNQNSFFRRDIFLSKFTPDGRELIFSTFLGGIKRDTLTKMVVDDSGSIYLTGITHSPDFPTENAFNATYGGGADVFLTKFSSDGQSLEFSTFLGGSKEDGRWICSYRPFKYNMIIDETGHIILSGVTSSPDFPTKNAFDGTLDGWTDLYITKFSPDGQSLVFSTYLGGSDIEYITNMKIDFTGYIILSGWTLSQDFPLFNALNETNSGIHSFYTDISYCPEGDGFLAKLSTDGQFLDFSTYLGGSDVDYIAELEIDLTGNIITAGKTKSNDFPLINHPPKSIEKNNIFISIFSSHGEKRLYSNLINPSKNITDFWGGEGSLKRQTNIKLMVNQTDTLFLAGCAEDCYLSIGEIDSDQDWMDNNWEVIYGLDPTRNDALEDLDGDGIPNFWEFLMGLIPNYDDAQEDLDNDGMPNLWEYQMGLSANINDTYDDLDNDNMHNLWEYQMGLNASFNDAQEDKDGDWVINLLEYQENTDASDFWSVPLFYTSFPFICFSCVHFLFLSLVALSGFLGFTGAYNYKNYKRKKLMRQLSAPDYETVVKMVQGGFSDYETFKKAQELKIASLEEYIFALEMQTLEEKE